MKKTQRLKEAIDERTGNSQVNDSALQMKKWVYLGESWQKTPHSFAAHISKSLLEEGVLLIMRSIFINIIKIAKEELSCWCAGCLLMPCSYFPQHVMLGNRQKQSAPNMEVQQKTLYSSFFFFFFLVFQSADINVTKCPLHHFTWAK